MGFLEAIVMAVVEGLTEFLPISSTGHLVLTADLLKVPQTEFVKSFEILIQLGAILAVVGLYAKSKLFQKAIFLRLCVAFIPTAVAGLLLYKFVKSYLLGNVAVTLWALFLGGIALIVVEKFLNRREEVSEKKIEDLSLKQAALIGVSQAIAIVPGVSRAAATIIGGRFLKLSRQAAVEFSFLLAVPTMLAATGLDIVQGSFSFSTSEWLILGVGFIGAYLSALAAVKYFLKFIQTHTFVSFGIYRIILAALFWLVVVA